MATTLDKWEKLLLEPNAPFSASDARNDIKALLKELSTPTKNRARALYLAYLVELKTQNADVAMDYGIECHRLQEKTKSLTPLQHFNLCYQVGTAAAAIEDYVTASEYLELAYDKRAARGTLTEDQILGLQEKWAHALHEAGHFQKALEVNLRVLKGAEKMFGRDSANLYGILNNIAQNHYMLKDTDKAEEALQRALIITQTHDDAEKEYDIVFQLGVLCAETDRHDEAIEHFKYQIEVAESIEDEDLIRKAKTNLIRAKRTA